MPLPMFVFDRAGDLHTGDLLIDLANALTENDWQSRWPKRPGWLARRLH